VFDRKWNVSADRILPHYCILHFSKRYLVTAYTFPMIKETALFLVTFNRRIDSLNRCSAVGSTFTDT